MRNTATLNTMFFSRVISLTNVFTNSASQFLCRISFIHIRHPAWSLYTVYSLSLKAKAGKVSRSILMPIEILTNTREMPYENQLCQQILLLPPHGAAWAMLWITTAKRRGWKASFQLHQQKLLTKEENSDSKSQVLHSFRGSALG